jgi:hypothetical protein
LRKPPTVFIQPNGPSMRFRLTVAGVTGGSPIDRRSTVRVVLRDMRRAAARATAGDEVGGIVVLVAAYRAAGLGVVRDHVEGRGPLRRAIGFGYPPAQAKVFWKGDWRHRARAS